MFQPFVQFEPMYLERLIRNGRVYLVAQTYKRAFDHFDTEPKIALLLSDYADPGLANIHFNAVKEDKYAAIIKLSKEEHLTKLKDMMGGKTYRLYWSVIQKKGEMLTRIDLGYTDKIRRFIKTSTNWHVGGSDKVQAKGIEVTFGEFFIVLKWRTQKLRVKFEEIEKA